MRYNTEMKGRLNREHANSLDLSSKLQRCKIDLQTMTQANEDLQIAGERQKMEFSALSSVKELVEADLAESMRLFTTGKSTADASESQLRSMLAGRDSEICEVSTMNDVLSLVLLQNLPLPLVSHCRSHLQIYLLSAADTVVEGNNRECRS